MRRRVLDQVDLHLVADNLEGPLAGLAAEPLEDVGLEAAHLAAPQPQLPVEPLLLLQNTQLLLAHGVHFLGQVGDLVHLALAAVLGGDFVLAAATDVAARVDLLLAQPVTHLEHQANWELEKG